MNRKDRSASFASFLIVICLLSATTEAQRLVSRSATANSYSERGNAWYAKGEYKRALADYDLAIALNPTFAHGYYNRACAYYYLKEYKLATADFTRAIELDPHLAKAYVDRSAMRYLQGDLDGVISDAARAVELDHNLTSLGQSRHSPLPQKRPQWRTRRLQSRN
jgi:tetratricopeptide (TPR) repeat protein